MTTIKTIVFFLALLSTFGLIEDGIEKTIINSKKPAETFRVEYVTGITHTFNGWLIFTTTFLWTLFYVLNQF
jgi:hypothetical protein